MKIFRKLSDYRAYLAELRKEGRSIGFVPTMGYLHAGHVSLMERAKRDNDLAVVSVFVNPLQFGPNEDFDRYPRDEERDIATLEKAGVDVAIFPSVEEMYPQGAPKTRITVSGVTERLCGASRPGHFDGVATVVMKLLHIVSPDRVYFGMKDAQQVAVIERMVADLNVPVEVIPCPTLREADGLALSSRNIYLTKEERSQAPALYQTLASVEERLRSRPDLAADELKQELADQLRAQAPLGRIDYVDVLSYPDLEPIEGPLKQVDRFIVALAVHFGKARLIDNRLLENVQTRRG